MKVVSVVLVAFFCYWRGFCRRERENLRGDQREVAGSHGQR